MLRFLSLFLVILLILFGAELTRPAQQALVMPWTSMLARLCAAVVTSFDGQAIAFGNVLQNTTSGFAVAIQPGCNGMEAALILIAAIMAFPASWKRKAAGIAVGVLAIQALNLVRVVSLFYLGQWSRPAFEWAHLYLWQALIMVDVLVVWLLWLRWVRAGDVRPAAA